MRMNFNTGAKIRIMRTSGHVYYHVRKPNENTFHIQYHLFFDYNDPEVSAPPWWNPQHYADWEWLCVYTDAKPYEYYDNYPSVGKIWKLHYHHHGVNPFGCGACKCGDWSDVSFTRGTGEWSPGNVCILNDIEFPIDYCYLYDPNVVPENPRVWVGDDVHGLWDGYPKFPRPACSYLTFNEEVNNYPARLPDNITVPFFPHLISITPSSSDDYDQTVHMYMGKWGSDADSPKGPFVPGGDRDFNGVYDGY